MVGKNISKPRNGGAKGERGDGEGMAVHKGTACCTWSAGESAKGRVGWDRSGTEH
jgi:hypothetical protein